MGVRHYVSRKRRDGNGGLLKEVEPIGPLQYRDCRTGEVYDVIWNGHRDGKMICGFAPPKMDENIDLRTIGKRHG